MIKNYLFLLLVFLSLNCFSQTVTKRPIYQSALRGLTIQELQTGSIYFSYQYMSVLESFMVDSKAEAINLMKEALIVVTMPRTARDQNIEHGYAGVNIFRMGIKQKYVFLERLSLNKNQVLDIINSLENS